MWSGLFWSGSQSTKTEKIGSPQSITSLENFGGQFLEINEKVSGLH